ncbi:sigma-70 family RNA polymerase sigma factor [uncultured Sphingomonas sp.]|uniref:sigma-70 family RNA polymerase sigma factor n=1 Tax=uncultured Sphingomonas sp. TaxID=158754 RepID=UPI0025E54B35|nr:sigma-70 family RNA polymerase sigma factor [uncultured Sphingomonas sp.]
MMRRSARFLALFSHQRSRLIVEAARMTGDRASAEDVVQDAWLRLSQNARDTQIAEPVGYIRRVVRNLALDEYRQRQRRERVMSSDAGDAAETLMADTAGVDRALMARQELALVAAELARMPPRMRRAVELHRLSGAPLREIAAELGVSVTGAHALVTEGVERCRKSVRGNRH